VFLFAAIVSATPLPQQAQATVRIVQAQRVTHEDWDRSARKRQIEIIEDGRTMTIRLIEFE
jgi:hypothetical protein